MYGVGDIYIDDVSYTKIFIFFFYGGPIDIRLPSFLHRARAETVFFTSSASFLVSLRSASATQVLAMRTHARPTIFAATTASAVSVSHPRTPPFTSLRRCVRARTRSARADQRCSRSRTRSALAAAPSSPLLLLLLLSGSALAAVAPWPPPLVSAAAVMRASEPAPALRSGRPASEARCSASLKLSASRVTRRSAAPSVDPSNPAMVPLALVGGSVVAPASPLA
mmetsp:Transcript_921/g.3454  ORF Transcript_921/g.3454 Transcript_921/m.3454 type:complete len:224 (+) Transcript_921:489-1160(+)